MKMKSMEELLREAMEMCREAEKLPNELDLLNNILSPFIEQPDECIIKSIIKTIQEVIDDFVKFLDDEFRELSKREYKCELLERLFNFEDPKYGYVVFYKLVPKVRKLNTFKELRKEICTNNDPFVIGTPDGYYYVRQKKSKFILHGENGHFVIKFTKDYTEKEIKHLLNRLKSVTPYEDIEDIIFDFDIKLNSNRHLDFNLFLKNILVDNPDIIITHFEISEDEDGIYDFIITINSTDNKRLYQYLNEYLETINLDDNFLIKISK